MKEYLIQDADHLLTMDDARQELQGADILIRDGVIAQVGHGLETSGEVIRGQAAARECQLCQPQLGGDLQMRRSHARPDRVERLEPTEQQRILPARHGPGQCLV